jgi:hypothetical protein
MPSDGATVRAGGAGPAGGAATRTAAQPHQAPRSEVKLRAILNSTSENNLLLGKDFKVLSFNKARKKM